MVDTYPKHFILKNTILVIVYLVLFFVMLFYALSLMGGINPIGPIFYFILSGICLYRMFKKAKKFGYVKKIIPFFVIIAIFFLLTLLFIVFMVFISRTGTPYQSMSCLDFGGICIDEPSCDDLGGDITYVNRGHGTADCSDAEICCMPLV